MFNEWLAPEFQIIVDQALVLGLLIFARLLPIVLLAPHLGGEALPQMVRIALTLALTIFVYPTLFAVGEYHQLPTTMFAVGLLLIKELCLGFTIGYITRLIFDAVQMAGQIIDNMAGLTMATMFAPQLPERVSISANLLFQCFIAIFFLTGLHLLLIYAVVHSFHIFEPHQSIDLAVYGEWLVMGIVRLSVDCVAIALQLAAPVVIAVLMTNIVLGLINKSAPQINVFFLGMPIKAMMAVILLLLCLKIMMDVAVDVAISHLEHWVSWYELLAGTADKVGQSQ